MAVETNAQTALNRFIAKTRDLFSEEPNLDKRWELLKPVLSELLADPEVQEASQRWPDCVAKEGRAENLLFYEDADYGFAINGLTKGGARRPGERTRIHDHGHIYTLYGVLDGRERIERYERTDDGSKWDYRPIRRTDDVMVESGDIDLVKPFEVHAEVTVGQRTVAVIIRSQKAGEHMQGRYDPDTGAYFESVGPVQTPAEFYPSK